MVSEDTSFESLSPINSAGDDLDKETESRRERQAPNELPKAKGKGKSSKKRRRTFDVGEPSEASLQPEPKGKEEPVQELIKKKSVPEVLKILRHRINRRIKNDQIADMKSYIRLLSFVIQHQLSDFFSPIVKSRDNILIQWPAWSDLDDIKKDMAMKKKERGKARLPAHNDEMKMEAFPGLEDIERKIKNLDETRLEDSAKTDELAETFLTKGVSTETLREKFSTVFPWLFGEACATNRPALDQFQGSLQTREQCTDKDMEDLEKELFDKDNIIVNVSDFCGLQDAINTAEDYIPDHLKSIAKKIEDDRGERTPAIDIYQRLLVLVSAAVKEMEDLVVDELDMPILRKWAATFNLAKRMRFQVTYFEKLLKKNMHAYFSYSRLNGKKGLEIRG